MVNKNQRFSAKMQVLVITIALAALVIPTGASQVFAKKCDDHALTTLLSKKTCAPCTVACMPTLTVTNCEINFMTSGFMDLQYATSMVPVSVGTPLEDAPGIADGTMEIWFCQGGSFSNGTNLGAFMLASYEISIILNSSIPTSPGVFAKWSAQILTDSTAIASFLRGVGANVGVTTFTGAWIPFNGLVYAPLVLQDSAGAHFQIARDGVPTNKGITSWPFQFFTSGSPATWWEMTANITDQTLPVTANLLSQDAFWHDDPVFGGTPMSFLASGNMVQTMTLQAKST